MSLSLEPGGAAVAMATEPGGDVLDRCLRKVDLAAKVWAKKGAAGVVFARLGGMREAALRFAAAE